MRRTPINLDHIMKLHLQLVADAAIATRTGISLQYIRRIIQRERRLRGLTLRTKGSNAC